MVQSRVFLVRFGIHAVTLQIVGFCQFLKYQCVARRTIHRGLFEYTYTAIACAEAFPSRSLRSTLDERRGKRFLHFHAYLTSNLAARCVLSHNYAPPD